MRYIRKFIYLCLLVAIIQTETQLMGLCQDIGSQNKTFEESVYQDSRITTLEEPINSNSLIRTDGKPGNSYAPTTITQSAGIKRRTPRAMLIIRHITPSNTEVTIHPIANSSHENEKLFQKDKPLAVLLGHYKITAKAPGYKSKVIEIDLSKIKEIALDISLVKSSK